LIDSGADYSLLRKETLGFLGVNIATLERCGSTRGITNQPIPACKVECVIEISYKGKTYSEEIPFQVLIPPDVDPSENLLGRTPFFSNHTIDFRMGFTDDPDLGKFVIYLNEGKRKSSRYKKIQGYHKK
jgi:hypothetical protein